MNQTHQTQINLTNTIQFLKSKNALSKENAIEITSEQWYELGFVLGAPLGSLLFSSVKRTKNGKYWFDQNATKFYIQLNRIFVIIIVTIIILILIYAISMISQQNQAAEYNLSQPEIEFYTDRLNLL